MNDNERKQILKSFREAIKDKAEDYLNSVVGGDKNEGRSEYDGIYEIALLAKETVDNLTEKEIENED